MVRRLSENEVDAGSNPAPRTCPFQGGIMAKATTVLLLATIGVCLLYALWR